MPGLDDLLGGLAKQAGGSGGGGLEDLLGGLLGGATGGSGTSGAAAGGLGDILGGLLGGGSGTSGGSVGTSASAIDTGALVAALGPIIAKLIKGGGLSKLVESAKTSGLSAQADSWVGSGENAPVSGQEVRSVVGDDTVTELAARAGIPEDKAADVLAQVVPKVVDGLTPDGQLPADDDLDKLVAKFGG